VGVGVSVSDVDEIMVYLICVLAVSYW